MEKKYAVFYKYGMIAHKGLLNKKQAFDLAKTIEEKGKQVLISIQSKHCMPNGEITESWTNIYVTKKVPNFC